MQTLAPSFTITADLDRSEVHFAASGLFDLPSMVEFQKELIAKSKPLIERGAKMKSLGDLRGFVTQTREVSDTMRMIVLESQKLGVVKTAIVVDSMLVKMQYARVNEGINAELFESKSDAIAWLRSMEPA